jgi:8-oxo-dGTP pyrophosphatase MutT (NUDIX family)
MVDSFDDLLSRLEQRLARGLPGRSSQERFAPELCYGRHFGPTASTTRAAAVAVLLYRKRGVWHLPLTRRPATLKDHAGQICLPGGAAEPGEPCEVTCLRELQEELGAGPDGLRVLGRLSPIHLFVSDFAVIPCLVGTTGPITLQAQPGEVDELIELPVTALVDQKSHGWHELDFFPARFSEPIDFPLRFRAPYIAWREHRIWGATAIILGELIALLDR